MAVSLRALKPLESGLSLAIIRRHVQCASVLVERHLVFGRRHPRRLPAIKCLRERLELCTRWQRRLTL